MMWKASPDTTRCRREPIELRILKHQLATLNCNCKTCIKATDADTFQQDQQVQVKVDSGLLDRFIQVTPKQSLTGEKSRKEISDSLRKDMFCPSCFVTLNLLRGGLSKVVKDEEVETKLEAITCNKSTENVIISLEKTTSVTNKPVLKYSNISLNEYITDRSSVGSVGSDENADKHYSKKSSTREVKFLLEPEQDLRLLKPEPQIFISRFRNCLCVDELIDTIRPPLKIGN